MVTLVTGFGPFLDVADNASWHIARALGERSGFVAVELPTSFARAPEVLAAALARESAARLVCVGIARAGDGYRVEAGAAGVVTSTHADIDGIISTGVALGGDGAPRQSVQDVEALAAALREVGLDARSSRDCGGYVCNSTYHAALGLRPDALFLHIPPEADAASVARGVTAVETLVARLEARRAAGASARHRLHLLGLRGRTHEVAPGYQRGEARLRRELPRGLPVWATVADALAAPEAPPLDLAWFRTRDEAETPARQAAEARVPPLSEGWLVLSPALREVPALAPRLGLVAAGLDAPPSLCLLARAALHPAAVIGRALPSLDLAVARFAALMIAGATLAPTLPSSALDQLLTDVADHLLPPQHRARETEALLAACREAGLLRDHPGELERIVHGLSRRRADRVHRAWLRGSFALPATTG